MENKWNIKLLKKKKKFYLVIICVICVTDRQKFQLVKKIKA